jgi:hypothetical protein
MMGYRHLHSASERTRCRTCNEIYLRLRVQQRGLFFQRIRGAPVVWVPIGLDTPEQLSASAASSFSEKHCSLCRTHPVFRCGDVRAQVAPAAVEAEVLVPHHHFQAVHAAAPHLATELDDVGSAEKSTDQSDEQLDRGRGGLARNVVKERLDQRVVSQEEDTED